MKKTYRLQNLECAHCAAKMETAIGKLPGVEKAQIHFMTQKLVLEASEDALPSLEEQIRGVIRKIEPDCRLTGK
ncbi:MAG: heavy-metal-associated domain-containing protein [Eubacteriales bacterium]|jgi:copper chaperone CopZ